MEKAYPQLLIAFAFSCLLLLLLSPVASSVNNSQPIIRFQVLEKSPAGTFVGNVLLNSTLADLYPDQSNLQFSLRSTDPSSSYFVIDNTTAVLRTSAKSINRDDICAYLATCVLDFTVQVLALNDFQVLTVAVTVIDINDHTPTFTPNSIRLNISESDPPGRTFLLPGADDPDGGIDGVQSYRLQPNLTQFQLTVGILADGSADVRLRLMTYLKRSVASSYSLIVLAVDGGSPAKTGSLSVGVTVVETGDPQQSLVFVNSTYEATVVESVSPGASVLRVEATYQGTGSAPAQPGQILYAINQQKFVGINNRTGDIFVATQLDHEKYPVVLLTVTAVDQSRVTSSPAYVRVTIHVTDSNDNAPVITVATMTSDGVAEVKDTAPIGSIVAYIGVTDADEGVNGQVDCVINTTLFRLEPVYTDYKLNTAVTFGRDSAPSYAVVVTCTDRGSPPLTSSAAVQIRVVFTGPFFTSPRYLVDFSDNNAVGDVIVDLNVTGNYSSDRTSNLLFGYSPVTDTPSGVISVDSTSGVVTANVVFKFDVRRQYSYVVTVTDVRLPSVTATSTLIVSIVRRPSTAAAGSVSPDTTVTPSGSPAAAPSPIIKDTGNVIITAVVCATVIVVVIVIVVAVAVVCYRRYREKALISAAAQLAKGPGSISSDGERRLMRSVSSVSSSVASGERRESRLGSIREESFEELQVATPTGEWPLPPQSPYSGCEIIGLESSFPSAPMRKGIYARSASHPTDTHYNSHRSAKAARYNDRSTAEDGSDTSRVTDAESGSCCSGSLTDSGRGHSLQDHDNTTVAGSAAGFNQPCPPPPPPPPASQQVFRTDSDCSGSSTRPLFPTSTKFPIENKIYITNHFRDALPRHSSRPSGSGGVRKEQRISRAEPSRSSYFDARSRVHLENPQGPRSRSAERERTSPSSSRDSSGSRVGEFTKSLYAGGHDNGAYANGYSRKQVAPPGEDLENDVAMHSMAERHQTPPGELNYAYDGHHRDTFV